MINYLRGYLTLYSTCLRVVTHFHVPADLLYVYVLPGQCVALIFICIIKLSALIVYNYERSELSISGQLADSARASHAFD